MSDTPDLDLACPDREAAFALVNATIARMPWKGILTKERWAFADAILQARAEEAERCLSKAPSRGDLKTVNWFTERAASLRSQIGEKP